MALQHFLNLPSDKQEQILQAALREFITYGYDLASTNRIVEAAEISKGSLFKYFKTKEDLFLYLFHHCGEIALQASGLQELDQLPDEFFEAMKAVAWREFLLYQQHPDVYAFFQKIGSDLTHPVHLKAFASYQDKSMDLFMTCVHELLLPHLRPDLPLPHALEVLHYTLAGTKKKLISLAPPGGATPDELLAFRELCMQEMDVVFAVLKGGMYRKDGE